MVRATREVPVTSIAPLESAEAERLYAELTASMATLLRDLTPEEWERQTDCELWRVRDMIAHLTGWSEALVSPRELMRQGMGAFGMRKELGNLIDAQNQVQVDERRDLAPGELLARFESAAPRAAARRRATSRLLGWFPVHMNYMGGWIDVRYLSDVIFTRDVFMHRIDISRATERTFVAGPADQRLFDDIVRDWFDRSKAEARLEIDGELRGTYVSADTPRATLAADGIEFTRMLFGRAGKEVVTVEGDRPAADRWLDTFFPV